MNTIALLVDLVEETLAYFIRLFITLALLIYVEIIFGGESTLLLCIFPLGELTVTVVFNPLHNELSILRNTLLGEPTLLFYPLLEELLLKLIHLLVGEVTFLEELLFREFLSVT